MIGRSRRDGFNPMRIILAGAAVSAMLTALSQGIALAFRLNQTVTFWTAGGVSGTTWSHLKWAIPLIGIALFIILTISKQLTILNLGESLAKGLGQNVTMIRGICFNYCYDSSRYSSCYRWTSCICRFDGTSYSKIFIGTDYAKNSTINSLVGWDTRACCRCDSTIFRRSACWRNHFIYRCSLLLYLVKKGGTLNMISSNNKRRQLIALAVLAFYYF